MIIELTEEQQRALDALQETPARVVDPRTQTTYVLVPATEYDTLRELLEEEATQRAIHAIALQNAVGRLRETG